MALPVCIQREYCLYHQSKSRWSWNIHTTNSREPLLNLQSFYYLKQTIFKNQVVTYGMICQNADRWRCPLAIDQMGVSVMAKQLKKSNQCLYQRERNGYSIAEILLVFGIIAGVLFGVWAMYTLLADDADAKAVVAEILLIQGAAVQYKQASSASKYLNIGSVNDSGITPYLGDGIRTKTNINMFTGSSEVIINTFGDEISLIPLNSGEDLALAYGRTPSMNVCLKALQRFGNIQKVLSGRKVDYNIPPGETVSGFVGHTSVQNSGCGILPNGQARLVLTID